MEKRTETIREISVVQWHHLAQDGVDLPISMSLSGESMRPLIRRDMDTVTILPLRRQVRPGDIVLFADHRGRYVVHRVCKRKGSLVVTIGDHCHKADSPLSEEQVWGLVTTVTRGNRKISVDNAAARSLGRLWMMLLPLRSLYDTIRNRGKKHGTQ